MDKDGSEGGSGTECLALWEGRWEVACGRKAAELICGELCSSSVNVTRCVDVAIEIDSRGGTFLFKLL